MHREYIRKRKKICKATELTAIICTSWRGFTGILQLHVVTAIRLFFYLCLNPTNRTKKKCNSHAFLAPSMNAFSSRKMILSLHPCNLLHIFSLFPILTSHTHKHCRPMLIKSSVLSRFIDMTSGRDWLLLLGFTAGKHGVVNSKSF